MFPSGGVILARVCFVLRKNGKETTTLQAANADPSVHAFQEYTYKKITPCDVCSQVLRGESLRCSEVSLLSSTPWCSEVSLLSGAPEVLRGESALRCSEVNLLSGAPRCSEVSLLSGAQRRVSQVLRGESALRCSVVSLSGAQRCSEVSPTGSQRYSEVSLLSGHARQGLKCRVCKMNVHVDCQGQVGRCQPKSRLLRRQKSTSEIETRIPDALPDEENKEGSSCGNWTNRGRSTPYHSRP
uniref:Phorbol-ester/DAG-type domain-containing protein n=1 Tax=Timema poppense TaxID=170557 RepID=A0A7R9HBS3_TIMPO|nr:unnamed protein product [Timema poppensis]